MALDIKTLNNAGEALTIAFPEGYLVDPKLGIIRLGFHIHAFNLESQVLSRITRLDPFIREIAGQPDFRSLRDYVYFVPFNPEVTIEREKWFWAEINDEKVIRLLAKLGVHEKNRKESVKKQEAAARAEPIGQHTQQVADLLNQIKALKAVNAKQKEDNEKLQKAFEELRVERQEASVEIPSKRKARVPTTPSAAELKAPAAPHPKDKGWTWVVPPPQPK